MITLMESTNDEMFCGCADWSEEAEAEEKESKRFPPRFPITNEKKKIKILILYNFKFRLECASLIQVRNLKFFFSFLESVKLDLFLWELIWNVREPFEIST